MTGAGEDVALESAIYQMALSIDDPEVCRRFLDRVYASDGPARAEMEALIGSAGGSGRYFSEANEHKQRLAREFADEQGQAGAPAADDVPWEDAPGKWLGGYRLVRRIGAGATGLIYEAEQFQPVRRRVAVKILRHGMDSREILARFEVERQALAMMDHPGIAKVLDAGSTEGERPYLVMELVEGEKITDYCDHRSLGLTERILLFIQVCQAVQHAHQKGIIHRDIKPSNVLVTHRPDDTPFPKIIDFGIAKAADSQRLSKQTVFTSHDQFFGTPVYASPEQLDFACLDIDTRSDVYSLGVLLYELLTSMTPISPPGAVSITRLHEIMQDADFLRPSERLRGLDREELKSIADDRGVDPAQLVHAVRGDLDWIVLRAMEKARSRRYQTVNNLAVELERFLHDQPISARPPSRLYLMRKFVRRNRMAVALSSIIVLLLVAALAGTTTLYNKARQSSAQESRLRQVAEAARAEETRLRIEADGRATVARIAFLLHQGKIDEADRLYRGAPPASVGPSMEAASVFRSLAGWHAEAGRYDQALPCFQLLIQANRFDDPNKIMQGLDLIASGSVLAWLAPEDYRAYRTEVIDTYLPVEGPVEAERLLKFCLLAPISPPEHRKLREVVRQIDFAIPQTPPSWVGLTRSLDLLRSGDCMNSLIEAREALKDAELKRSCEASIHAVMAMAEKGLGQGREAASDLATARRLIQEAHGEDYVGDRKVVVYWFDWMVAKLLVAEAAADVPAGIPQ
ncbi:serine/threonine protein kinase [Haloferula sargassicola]|uniref:Serine/threonine-protein kinase PknD n=1 Tax=Haloferula sargassicola TaxID=490096 RepID=A0ABP9UK26_9BACT